MSGPRIPRKPTSAERTFTRPLRALTWSIQALLIANALNRPAAKEQAFRAVGDAMVASLALGHFLGSADVLRVVASGARTQGLVSQVKRALPTTIDIASIPPLPPVAPPILPVVGKPPVFRHALADLVTRVPTLVRPEALRTASEIGRLYATEHVFAAAKAADMATLRRVQKIVQEGILQGKSVDEQVRLILKETKDWTRGYAETVYRTNLGTSQVNGRFRQMRTTSARIVTPTLMFVATGHGSEGTSARTKDPRTRPNHWACDGMVGPPDWYLWVSLRPPLGYNCRCTVFPVTWDRMRRMGLLNPDGTPRVRMPRSGAAPDPGFQVARLP